MQCGICTPALLVAGAALLKRNSNPCEDEVKDALGGILCRCTGYRKIIAAVMDAGGPAADKTARSCRHRVAQSAHRLCGSMAFKVTGTENYGADTIPGNALWLKVVRSPHYHAHFEIGDISGFIANHKGVVAVFTADDLPGENRFGVIPACADQPALAIQTVRFRGEAVAVIAGSVMQ